MKELTALEVNELVYLWYQKLDVHAPVEELLPLLAASGLEMRFPEGTLQTAGDFRKWYKRVTCLFFDETHVLRMLNIDCRGATAMVKLVVNWQAHVWTPPAARSKWLGFDAWQTWIIRREAKTGRPVIAAYIVDKLDPMEGSASL